MAGCTNDIARAIIDCGKQNEIKLICYNFTTEVSDLVTQHIVDFTIGILPKKQGLIAMETLINYILTNHIPAKNRIVTPVYIGIDENIKWIVDN